MSSCFIFFTSIKQQTWNWFVMICFSYEILNPEYTCTLEALLSVSVFITKWLTKITNFSKTCTFQVNILKVLTNFMNHRRTNFHFHRYKCVNWSLSQVTISIAFWGFVLVRNGKKFKDFGFLLSHYPSILYLEILTQTKIHFLRGFTMRNDDTFSLFKSHSRTFHVAFALQTCRLFKPEALVGVFQYRNTWLFSF